MNLYTALSIVRNAAVISVGSEPSSQFKSAVKVIDAKLVGLERKRAWRNAEAGEIPRHMYLPRQTIPDCAAMQSADGKAI